MCEKRTENSLDTHLKSFDEIEIFYSPSENKFLKELFSYASKTGSGRGIPDRIIYNESILIIIECKMKSIKNALSDLKIYKDKMKKELLKDLKIYYVAYSETSYEIYNSDMKKIPLVLNRKNFITYKNNFSLEKMEKEIHNIHNYIRDYTKISNEDKPFFIACILISFKNTSFCKIIDTYDTKENIYELMRENLLKYDIKIEIFSFLRDDENNRHFLDIISMVRKIYKLNPSNDLLNIFYNEFVKYNNSDGKNLGIVLTPDYAVNLMISILNISENDTFLDLCSGTGSFPLKALNYNPKKIIACEYQTKLFNLLQCNMILRDVNNKKLIKGDCFDNTFKANKSAINPPYGMKDKVELDFIIKQIDCLKNEGLCCSIIPTTCLNNNKFLKRKKLIMEKCEIKAVINMSKICFYPNASINTSILLLKKTNPREHYKTLFVNYEDDKIILHKHIGLVKGNDFQNTFESIVEIIKDNKETDISLLKEINHSDDWNYHNFNTNIDFTITTIEYENKLNEFRYIQRKNELIQKFENSLILENNKVKKVYLNELFDIQTIKRTTLTLAKNNPGKYAYVSASGSDYGITCYTKFKTHTGPCLTLSNSGSVCKCFYHKGDICGTDSIYVLYLKKEYEYLQSDEFMVYLSCLIEKNSIKYSFGRACRLNKLQNDFIELKINEEGEIEINI